MRRIKLNERVLDLPREGCRTGLLEASVNYHVSKHFHMEGAKKAGLGEA